MLKDPHRYAGEIMNKTGYEVLQMLGQVKEHGPNNISMPLFAIHGADDELCYPSGSEWIHQQCKTPDELKKYEIFKVTKTFVWYNDCVYVVT